ncbi:hypothetical protein Tco_0875913 [Tanacetum coccineum]|uniref:Transposase n=1 Tax=Tanacetum coccineum TaxID=301880 RepID=A0ABQ5BTK4_9ASTR
MKAFRANRITYDIMTGSYREQYSLLREYAQELINQNPGITVRIDVQQEPNPESLTRTFRRVYVCLGALKQGFRTCGREILGLDGCFMLGIFNSWKQKAKGPYTLHIVYLFQVLNTGTVLRHSLRLMKSQFKGCVYRTCFRMQPKATSEGEFKEKDGGVSGDRPVFWWRGLNLLEFWLFALQPGFSEIPLEQWSRAHLSGRVQIEYLMKRIMVVQKVIAKTVEPLTPSVTKMFDGIKKRLLSTMFNGMEVHAAYRLETWAHVYSFKVNSCNGRDMWLVVESRTIIIPPLYKPPIGRPPKKRKKSNDEIVSQSASSGKLSRKGKSVICGKCGNVSHNRIGCRGQGGGSSQAGVRKVSGQATSLRKVSGQAAGARNISGQVVGAKKASSQPSAAQSLANQGPRQGFQGPIAGPASGSQRKTKKLVDI